MRRLVHGTCPNSVEAALRRRAENIRSGASIKDEWSSFRSLKAYRDLRTTLASFLGDRRRCCFCSDSGGADVEHFWPKEDYPDLAFQFNNLLLACTSCNRKKGTRFPLDQQNSPLLINPATDDPWDSLFFTPETGMISARLRSVDVSGELIFDPKGLATINVLGDILNGDPAMLGRQRNWVRILERLEEFIATSEYVDAETVAGVFGDVDEYGLTEWLIAREGKLHASATPILAMDEGRWRVLRDLPRSGGPHT